MGFVSRTKNDGQFNLGLMKNVKEVRTLFLCWKCCGWSHYNQKNENKSEMAVLSPNILLKICIYIYYQITLADIVPTLMRLQPALCILLRNWKNVVPLSRNLILKSHENVLIIRGVFIEWYCIENHRKYLTRMQSPILKGCGDQWDGITIIRNDHRQPQPATSLGWMLEMTKKDIIVCVVW